MKKCPFHQLIPESKSFYWLRDRFTEINASLSCLLNKTANKDLWESSVLHSRLVAIKLLKEYSNTWTNDLFSRVETLWDPLRYSSSAYSDLLVHEANESLQTFKTENYKIYQELDTLNKFNTNQAYSDLIFTILTWVWTASLSTTWLARMYHKLHVQHDGTHKWIAYITNYLSSLPIHTYNQLDARLRNMTYQEYYKRHTLRRPNDPYQADNFYIDRTWKLKIRRDIDIRLYGKHILKDDQKDMTRCLANHVRTDEWITYTQLITGKICTEIDKHTS